MGSDRDDELARTATAPSAPVAPSIPIDSTLGRYKIERELGAGGMGVVHAAFDPDLERRVALKVLRCDDGSGDARQRLLREARAMARLTHPNVVTVHEVGSAGGRDYVAMELVDGETLADWLRAARRPGHEILAAFVAAGRGLAAAHAAGIVHRDFKPHNVLRHRNGRIVVTDFGLAREAHEASVTDPLALTMPVAARAIALSKAPSSSSTQSALSGLTATGSVLGTPAYMAPEQWTGGGVTPASDQFAFCVGLWEALVGERPFKGATLEALREEVARGPEALDASKIPRWLRAALRRGLDPDPKRRWPSMEALISAMSRAERRPALAIAVASGVVVAAVIAYVGFTRSPSSAPAPLVCPPPSRDPAVVWPPGAVASFGASGRALEARAIDADFKAWNTARERACTGNIGFTTPRLACLDGVLGRLDIVARAVEHAPHTVPPMDSGNYLIDPAVCDVDRTPTLTATSPELREVLETTMYDEATPGPLDTAVATALAKRVAAEPCASALAHMLVANNVRRPADRDAQIAEAGQDSERCGDDRVRAEVATLSAQHAFGGVFLGAALSGKINIAASAVQRVAQPDLLADIDMLRLQIARRAENLDEALARGEAAMKGFAARGRVAAQLAVGMTVLDMLNARARPGDLDAMKRKQVELRKLGVDKLGEAHPMVRRLDGDAASHEFFAGDVADAHAKLEALRKPVPYDRARRVSGRVVDEHGAAAAGVTVTVGSELLGDSLAASVSLPTVAGGIRIATTNSNGEFEVADGPEDGVAIAQLGDRRSAPVALGPEALKLALEPTSRIEGHVDLRGQSSNRVILVVMDLRTSLNLPYALLSPVKPDGTFVVDGVARHKVRILVQQGSNSTSVVSITADVNAPVVRGIAITLDSSKRVVHVIVRSTVGAPVANAQVVTIPGQVASTNARSLNQQFKSASMRLARQIEREHAPPPVITSAQPGDMFATMTEVPEGVASACAVGLPGDLSDSELQRKVNAQMEKIEVRCVPIPKGADVVVVEVPPWPRFD